MPSSAGASPASPNDLIRLSDLGLALATKQNTLSVVQSTTAPATPVAGNYYQINASSPQTIQLPTSQPGQIIGFMQANLTTPGTNTISINGTINGVANSGLMLIMQNEAKIFLADSSGGWGVYSSNYGRSGLDQRYLRGMTSRVAQTANFAAAAQTMYSVDASGGAVTVTLPSTNTASDLIYIVKSDTSANLVTYTGTVNGTAGFSGSVRTQAQGKLFQGDGSGNWNIVAGDISVSALDLRYAPLAAGSGYSTTSSTSNTLGTGSKTFTVGTGLSWTAGQYALITNTGMPANNMVGTVTSYNASTGALVVNVLTSAGTAGTYTAWTVNLTGSPGPAGAVPTVNSSTALAIVSGTATPDASKGVIQFITASASFTLAAPTNPTQYQFLEIIILNTSSGAITASLAGGAGGFVFGATASAANFGTIAAGTYTRLTAQFNATANAWSITGYSQGATA